MANTMLSKRQLINKANTTVTIIVSLATFILFFSAIATKAFVSQAQYQDRLIKKKRETLNILKEDIQAAKKIRTSYLAFTTTTKNAIGGSTDGLGQQDGNNAKIVLDALPTIYDFPALTTSLEELLNSQQVKIGSIGGSDDEIAQSAVSSTPVPQAITIPFNFTITAQYDGVKNVIDAIERSIRPMQVTSLTISGPQDNLSLSINAQTYYQPAKSLKMKNEVVK